MPKRLPTSLIVCFVVMWLPTVSVTVAADRARGIEFFEQRIRPLLVEKCYECHSASAKKVKGGLLLDSKSGWIKGGDSGPVIEPGEPEKSLLIKAVRWMDPDFEMPPKNKLSDAEIAALVEWVKMGAPDPRIGGGSNLEAPNAGSPLGKTNHWAYQPPIRRQPPEARDKAWPRTDIDRFILAALEARDLKPVDDADRVTLVRRVYFDLLGLPPTREQIDQFVADAAPDAFARLVERLLASPNFGEHWARHWFDVVRFAESVTLRGFIFKEAWRYRDYVIEVFNRDVPFDRFLKEQIAGDLLPFGNREDRRRNLIATTFLAVGNWNLEEQDKKQLDMDVVDEQLDTIGKAFLGQTIGCARCHDHKFDPIPTRDYYAMAGILRNARTLKHANVSEWLEVALPVEPELEAKLTEHETAVERLQTEIAAAKEAAKALAARNGGPGVGGANTATKPAVVAATELPGIVVDSVQAKLVGAWTHSQYSRHYIGDGYWHDGNSGKGEKTLTFAPELTKPGRYEVRLAYVHAPNRATNVPVTVFHADGEATVHVNQQEAPFIEGRFISLGQFRFEANGFGYALVSNEGTHGHVIADAVQFLPVEEPAADARKGASRNEVVESQIQGKKLATLSSGALPLQNSAMLPPDTKALEEKLRRLKATGPRRPLVMSVKEVEKIEDASVHIRGTVHNLGPKVPRGFLQVATHRPPPPMPAHESGRREFADWIASSANPLTARVMANRVWLWLMGEGLVRTPDNFGTTGDTPSHPELLDFLATRLVDEGWSIKKVVREIVLSRTYQLNSVAAVAGATSPDQENRMFSHANRRRLTAEQIRDSILAVSGQLSPAGGGQTYSSNQTSDFGFVFSEPLRSVYAPVFRNALPEFFEVFDFAPSSMVTGRRTVSTVPTQALFLLNHPWIREQARFAANRLLAESAPNDTDRLNRAYRLTLGRGPTDIERQLGLSYLVAEGGRPSAPGRVEIWADVFQALIACIDFRYLN